MPARAYGRCNAHSDRTSAQNFSVSPKKPGAQLERGNHFAVALQLVGRQDFGDPAIDPPDRTRRGMMLQRSVHCGFGDRIGGGHLLDHLTPGRTPRRQGAEAMAQVDERFGGQ
jgi:hypothetical protein